MAKPKKTGHKSHDKIMEQDWQAKQGHNSGGVNPEVQGLFSEDEKLEDAIKTLQADRKAIRVRAKEEFGIPLRVWAIEKSMRKLDIYVRAEIEQAHADLKAMTGYQMAMNLLPPSDAQEDPIAVAEKKVANSKKSKKGKKANWQPIPSEDDDTYGLTADDIDDYAA